MSFIIKQKNISNLELTNPTGTPSAIYTRVLGNTTLPNGSSANIGGGGIANTGGSCSSGGGGVSISGVTIPMPYINNGWYYNVVIPPAKPEKVKVEKDGRDGCDCVKCREFYPFAEPNQEDGTLICFACRNGY